MVVRMIESRISVGVLVDAVRTRVAEVGLRKSGVEIGLSRGGLARLMATPRPQARTLRKLTSWYTTKFLTRGLGLDAAAAGAMLDQLTEHVPPAHREKCRARIVDALLEGARRTRGPIAEWLREIASEGRRRD